MSPKTVTIAREPTGDLYTRRQAWRHARRVTPYPDALMRLVESGLLTPTTSSRRLSDSYSAGDDLMLPTPSPRRAPPPQTLWQRMRAWFGV